MANSPHSDIRQYPTFVGSDRRIARFLSGPVSRFIHLEVSGGIVLLLATAAALIWINAPGGESYTDFWHEHVHITVGSWEFDESFGHLVNDGLMAIFFFVAGLEIKRELVVGELRNPRAAAVPALAALGGMVVPALIYVALNVGTESANGWGIPMATDIAFALGVVALLGSRVPSTLKVFLLTLAIVDDIGAILVIAVFYSDSLDLGWLAVAFGLLILVTVLQRVQVWSIPVYVVLGIVIWYAMLESGVHATIAGVALGLLTPARPLLSRQDAERIAHELDDAPDPADVRLQAFKLRESVPVVNRLESALHPYTSYLVIPIFALANAGIELSASGIADAATEPVTLGVVLGLVLGKPIGIVLFAYLGTRIGLTLPRGSTWPQMVAIGLAAGIGFTVSIFVSGLAFDDPTIGDNAKMGILAGSALAAIGALIMLWITCRGHDQLDPGSPSETDEGVEEPILSPSQEPAGMPLGSGGRPGH